MKTTPQGEQLVNILNEQVKQIKAAGTFKAERIINTPQGANIGVDGVEEKVLNFCANNYLGLSNSDVLKKTATGSIEKYGYGLSSVRFICGTQNVHKRLEGAITKFHETEDTILYSSCYDANGGLFETLLTAEDAIISDALNHASIIDGVRLCKAKRFRYKHMDMADLERCLEESKDCRMRMIATDGVFSMDGDVAPLKAICDLADKHQALVMVDDSHATGFFGPTGRGSPEFCGVMDRIDVLTSTLGKALGGASGGYTTGRKAIVDILRQRSRPYLFSNSLAPVIAGTTLKVFEMLMGGSDLVNIISANTMHFRKRMTEAGFELGGKDSGHAICPVMLYDARLATEFADLMLGRGIYVIGFSFPVVPKGAARIRVQISAAHTTEQLDRAIDAFIEIGKQLKVLK